MAVTPVTALVLIFSAMNARSRSGSRRPELKGCFGWCSRATVPPGARFRGRSAEAGLLWNLPSRLDAENQPVQRITQRHHLGQVTALSVLPQGIAGGSGNPCSSKARVTRAAISSVVPKIRVCAAVISLA